MCSRVGTGQRLSQRIEYWIEYDGNRPHEQGQWTGSYWHMWVERISTNVETFIAL